MENLKEKHVDIVNGAKELFWKFGIKRVTINEICEKADVSRGTFYKYFDNKDQLAIFIIQQVVDETMKDYQDIMELDIKYSEKMQKVVEMKLKGTDQMSKEFINDLYGEDFPELREFLEMKTKESLDLIINDFREAQWNGNIRKDIKIEFIMYFMNKMREIIIDPQFENLYENTQEMVNELTKFFFYGIIEREE